MQLILNRINNVRYFLKLKKYEAENEYRLQVPYTLGNYQMLGNSEVDHKGRKILKFPLPHECVEKILVRHDSRSKVSKIINELGLPLNILTEYTP